MVISYEEAYKKIVHLDKVDIFLKEVFIQYRKNIAKWGKQNMDILFKAAIEEMGEIARALLGNSRENHDFRKECIHLAAVLYAMFNIESK